MNEQRKQQQQGGQPGRQQEPDGSDGGKQDRQGNPGGGNEKPRGEPFPSDPAKRPQEAPGRREHEEGGTPDPQRTQPQPGRQRNE
jgi:hypothetical protein